MISTHLRPRTPSPRPIRPQRSLKGKAVSMAIAFKCVDGMVLCSDCEMSAGAYNYYEGKISLIGLTDSYFLMAQAASDADDIPTIHQRILSKIRGSQRTLDEIKAAVQGVLDGFGWSKENVEHESLIAIMPDPNQCVLWKTRNSKISDVLQSHTVIGFRNSALTQYILAVFSHQFSPITIQRAAIYGVHVMRQAKKFIPDCGGLGPTDVVMFPTKTGNPYHVPIQFVEEMERFLDSLEMQASMLFSTLIDIDSGESYNAFCINQFSEFAKRISEKAQMFRIPGI
jgi:hypothetical protein